MVGYYNAVAAVLLILVKLSQDMEFLLLSQRPKADDNSVIEEAHLFGDL